MTVQIPERLAYLMTRETRAFAQLSLVCADGTPRVWPVWFDYDGTDIILNTARGRLKDRIMQKRPTAAMAINDPQNPYKYLLIIGPVVHETEEGGYEGIADLNQKYKGDYDYPKHPGEVRVVYKVRPERVYPRE
jgi:PPOX class probable F420-dependent enzyme